MLIFPKNFEYFLGLTAMQTEHRTIPVEVSHMPGTDPGLSKGCGGGGGGTMSAKGASVLGRVVNGPLKNKKSWQILPKSRNLAQPTNGSRSFRFCICQSHICFSIKLLNFSVSVSYLKMPVSASRQVLDLPSATPSRGVSGMFL